MVQVNLGFRLSYCGRSCIFIMEIFHRLVEIGTKVPVWPDFCCHLKKIYIAGIYTFKTLHIMSVSKLVQPGVAN